MNQESYKITVKPAHPTFLDLPWEDEICDWPQEKFIELPKAFSRHQVRFITYDSGIYVIKELPTQAAVQEYSVLKELENHEVHTAVPVALITNRFADEGAERSAALITEYIEYSLSYFELLQGPGFGFRRKKMLDAFANLLVQLHLSGFFWGDCSLGNVLYRYDADGIEVFMIDGETAKIYEKISDGQRGEDLIIMIENIAGGMADIAASQAVSIDQADFDLGEDIAKRYRCLWAEVVDSISIHRSDHHLIHEKIRRLNQLGFDVEEIKLSPQSNYLTLKIKVGGRTFHTARLKGLTGVDALERQARVILSDVHYYQVNSSIGNNKTHNVILAAQWRMKEFEPMLIKLAQLQQVEDPIQAYCDLLNHRFEISKQHNRAVPTSEAFDDWLNSGLPGYPEDEYVVNDSPVI